MNNPLGKRFSQFPMWVNAFNGGVVVLPFEFGPCVLGLGKESMLLIEW